KNSIAKARSGQQTARKRGGRSTDHPCPLPPPAPPPNSSPSSRINRRKAPGVPTAPAGSCKVLTILIAAYFPLGFLLFDGVPPVPLGAGLGDRHLDLRPAPFVEVHPQW